MKKLKSLLFIFGAGLFIFLSLVSIKSTLAQTALEGQVDAIGVRIVPNPNHHSISRWYKTQGFYGSPQSLIVDGYEAIRDGRTVYVNAANIVDKTIYTNIYVISYNQEPSEKTIDILGQIISRWKFNSNLDLKEISAPATCSISSKPCNEDSDCGAKAYCSKTGISSGSCALREAVNCRIDSQCPSNYFCDSDKAKVTRDMKRIGRLGEMREALANYNLAKGNYPLLSSGSYLSGKTVSLWPSWQQLFLTDIAVSPNFIDPINRLGYCPGYEPDTCWNIEEKKFYSSPEADSLVLPEGSYAMIYSTDSNGSNYNLCAVLESRHPSLGYGFSSNEQNDSACVTDIGILSEGRTDNVAPILVDYNLSGQVGKEFNGFIKVFDENNDPLSWELVKGNDNWSSWSSDFPKILDTSNQYQKKIYASRAGLKATELNSNFPLTLRVSDGRGGVLEKELEVDIQDYGLFIEAQNATHVLDKDRPFVYSIYVSGDKFDNPAAVFIREKGTSLLPANLFTTKSSQLVSQDRYQITFTAPITPADFQLANDQNFSLEVVAKDKNNREFKKSFSLQLVSEKPILQYSCPLSARAGKNYSCLLGRTNYLNHSFSYQSLGQPADTKVELKNEGLDVYLEGVIKNISDNKVGKYEIAIKAKGEYGAVNEKKFNLIVNTSCGDGIKQEPNTEGKGGPFNDGFELCDGESGIATSAAESSIDKQYGCRTEVGSEVPWAITTRTYCVFKQSLAGGGYCQDGFCQTDHEDKNTCPQDCGYPLELPEAPEIPVDLCGNNVCDPGETLYNCLQDCIRCGDTVCSPGETPMNCAVDCPCEDEADCSTSYYCKGLVASCTGPYNHSCSGLTPRSNCDWDPAEGGCWWQVETPGRCTQKSCGNGVCGNDEDFYNCPEDCACISCIMDDECGSGVCQGTVGVCEGWGGGNSNHNYCQDFLDNPQGCEDEGCRYTNISEGCCDSSGTVVRCGDGTCSPGETLASCPKDCAVCPDGLCSPGETLASCPQDCVACPDGICSPGEVCYADCNSCGDGFCQTNFENQTTCSTDCGSPAPPVNPPPVNPPPVNPPPVNPPPVNPPPINPPPVIPPVNNCGNGICDPGETLQSCPIDCSVCNDGVCSGAETTYNCPSDCLECGDSICISSLAVMDCSSEDDKDPACYYRQKFAWENKVNCFVDCQTCGNGSCEADEDSFNCSKDCACLSCVDNRDCASNKWCYGSQGLCEASWGNDDWNYCQDLSDSEESCEAAGCAYTSLGQGCCRLSY